jgi:hypothetical protein
MQLAVLLVPPYLIYWASENDISQIPVLRFANHTLYAAAFHHPIARGCARQRI